MRRFGLESGEMDLNVIVKRLGKISEGDVNLKGFTVFAGRNSTGKTFLSKAIYSVLKGASSNHAWNLVGGEVQTLHRTLSLLQEDNETPPPVLEELGDLAGTLSPFISFLDKDGSEYAQSVRGIAANIDSVYKKEDREKIIKDLKASKVFAAEREVQKIEKAIDEIKSFAKLSEEKIIEKSVLERMRWFFIDNFRTRKLASLAQESSEGLELNINGWKIVSNQEELSVQMSSSSEIINIPSIFYLDAVGLKVDSRLIRALGRMRSRARLVPEMPGYHTDLLNAIEAVNLVPDDAQARVIANIAKSIGGKLEYERGSLHFHEEGIGTHAAAATSSGILQLGLLGLVVEKGLLRKSSFLFIDEPETNLHPDWQTLVSGLLAELALEGNVNIVMATHSPYIVQYLKYKAGKDDKFNDILSVNHFADKGINVGINDELSNNDRLERVEEDLNKRYMDIFLREELSD